MALAKQTSITNWNPQDSCIERLMDNSAYTSAHPDDTLVLVGPARLSDAGDFSKLTAVGMLQQMQISQQRAVQPVQAIGSGRNYFLSSKASVSFTIGRLFAKGPNLHRALYKNIISDANIDGFNDREPAAAAGHPNGVFNLDSELFLIPFGLVLAFRDKSGGNLGSFFIESCMISNYSIGIGAGQNVVMENVNGIADRVMPINLTSGISGVNNFFRADGSGNTVATENTTLSDGSLNT
jgi:hypothetical protein